MPIETPALIRATRSLAPCASTIRVIGFADANLDPPSSERVAGEPEKPTKARCAGGSLRTRRLRNDPPAFRLPRIVGLQPQQSIVWVGRNALRARQPSPGAHEC
jgi:hypothetical protein